jgi:putative endonuclease
MHAPAVQATVCAMTTQRRAVGAYGERVAAQHLQDLGLVILERNWRCSDGELDLVLRDGDDVVICEVKTRRTDRYGPPSEAVDRRKVRKLRHLARCWLAETGVHPREVRFDVVEVLPQERGAPQIMHIRAAF